jgi:hypothetical protein
VVPAREFGKRGTLPARRRRASACCAAVNFGGRPVRCRRFCARPIFRRAIGCSATYAISIPRVARVPHPRLFRALASVAGVTVPGRVPDESAGHGSGSIPERREGDGREPRRPPAGPGRRDRAAREGRARKLSLLNLCC